MQHKCRYIALVPVQASNTSQVWQVLHSAAVAPLLDHLGERKGGVKFWVCQPRLQRGSAAPPLKGTWRLCWRQEKRDPPQPSRPAQPRLLSLARPGPRPRCCSRTLKSLPHSKKAARPLSHFLSFSHTNLPYKSAPRVTSQRTQHCTHFVQFSRLFTIRLALSKTPQIPQICPRPQLPPSVEPASRRSAPRRTPTLPSVVSLPTCSLPMSSVRMFVRRTPACRLDRLARFSVSAGRPSRTSSAPPMRPRLPPTRSATKTKRLPTTRLKFIRFL
ncbi:hypothetical protein CRV24_008235 [Beauveria bassiana]|nr:hypothetical protein CRV24_008235 [Beauveria bassiana]